MSNLERRRLPFFPPITGNRGCYRIWHSHFIPELLAWAGAQENPFDVHSGIHTEVTRIWECLYPSVRLSDDLNTILTIMSKNAIDNWLSDVGKIGRKAVYDFIKSRFGRDHGERPKAFVADILTNYKFVYKHTERKTSSGPFRCALITKTAALALATLAIERGLILFMTGVNGGTAQRSDSIKFTNGSWGEKARQLVQVMKKLGDSEWNQIVEDRYLDHDVWPHQHQGVESDDDHQAEKLQRKRRA